MTEAEMFECTHCGKPVRMNPFNGYTLCPFCISKNEHAAKGESLHASQQTAS